MLSAPFQLLGELVYTRSKLVTLMEQANDPSQLLFERVHVLSQLLNVIVMTDNISQQNDAQIL